MRRMRYVVRKGFEGALLCKRRHSDDSHLEEKAVLTKGDVRRLRM